jgi:8-oxo-dGTP diphosphatase
MNYKNPEVAVDVVLVTVINKEVCILIRKRNEDVLKGTWALPGGIVKENEELDEKPQQILSEKVGLKEKVYLEQLYTFGAVKRDTSREGVRVISVSYLGIVDYTKIHIHQTQASSELKWVPASKMPELAFDHKEIVTKALDRVRNKLRYTPIGFSLVPKEFTIPELRENFEIFLGEKLNPTNFRTKLLKLGILDETGRKKIQGKGQPAPVYKLNHKKLSSLKNTETLFN